jgi:hypothetical protein
MERFAESETGTGFTLTRETVRDASTALALLATLSRLSNMDGTLEKNSGLESQARQIARSAAI